ncbi:hypothetical protein OBBRIDRAFT_467370 [Obba rivulosa]|uniref:DUF6533 domain-containing protein n=1 Tax=Obba rivulosa TaxID=1052685 RepID=A0A8E2B253_9APHY|nr:hypothetical protein OBBRIDRAFT_467370 [Obba rivulosa]
MSTIDLNEDTIFAVVSKAYFVKYANVAALTVAVFEYCLTLEDEILLVWSSRWSFTKVLFLVNRYLSFTDVALAAKLSSGLSSNLKHCITEYHVAVYFYIIGLVTAEALLGIRTYAIWHCDRRILFVLLVMYSGFFVGGIVFLHFSIQTQTFASAMIMQYESCMASTSDQRSWLAYLFLMAAELVVIVLTLVQRYISASDLPELSPLAHILYRDGMLFYCAMLGMSSINLSLMLAGPAALSSMMQMPMKAIHSVLCSRMLLNIRKASLNKQATSFSALSVRFAADSHLAFEDMELQDLHIHELEAGLEAGHSS